MILLSSCKKDPPQENPYYDQQLVLSFSNTTIPFNLVDSAAVIFKKQGAVTQVFKRFEKKNNSLAVVINDLSKGNWTADIYLYTRSADTTGRRYQQTITLTGLHQRQDITVTAPNGKVDDGWKPYIMFADAGLNVIAFVPMDNREAAFDIIVKDKKWDHFYIERYAHNRTNVGNEIMASADWQCNNGCYTNDNIIINTTSFAAFAEKVKTKTWNNGEIYLEVKDTESGEERSFFYTYHR